MIVELSAFGIVPKIVTGYSTIISGYSRIVVEEELYGHWELIGYRDVRTVIYRLHHTEFWSVIAFGIAFGTVW